MDKLIYVLCLAVLVVGCNQPDPEKEAMRQSIDTLNREKENLNREIANLQTQIKVERTPQLDLAEKLQKQADEFNEKTKKQAIEYQAQITRLQQTIAQTQKEKSEVAVIETLVPLQQQLKSQSECNASLKTEIKNLSQDLANFKSEMKKQLDDKASYHHVHWK